MTQEGTTRFAELLRIHEAQITTEWTKEMLSPEVFQGNRITEGEAREQCSEMIKLILTAVKIGNMTNLDASEWVPAKEMLASLSRSRAKQGFTPTEVAMFVFSLKAPLFALIQREMAGDPAALFVEMSTADTLLTKLGLWTTEVYLLGREEVIRRQQEDMLELSTPVVKLWDGVLALPIIGTLDSTRTQTVMENLLQAIVDTGAEVAIIDITGVPTVDTLVSQHLLKTVAAARLMGADCIISGIRPQIAQTIVHLGVDLTDVVTKSTLADAFVLALKRTGATITSASARK